MPLPPVTFPTLGFQLAHWMQTFLCHGVGDVEADPWNLYDGDDDEFLLFLCWVYRLWPEDTRRAGRRLVDRAILSRPKGRAKSELAGGMVCGEGLGPVRFDRWAEGGEVSYWGYEYQPGEPIGKAVRSPLIRCLATEEDQSGNTYDNVVVMLTQGRAAEEWGLREGREVGLTRTFLPAGGEIRPSTSGDASKDGGLETFAVADETHLYVLPKLRKMYRTVARNTGKRKDGEPLMLDTTTMFRQGEGSVAEHAADKYAKVDVETAVTKLGVLYDHRQGDEPKRFNDNRSLIKAMRPGYGPAAEWMDFERIARIIRGAEDPEEEAYRYYLNIARKAAEQWLSPDEIKPVLEEFEVPFGGKEKEKIGVGFDGSESDDHTVLFGCLPRGDVFTIGLWIPPGNGEVGWRADVMAAVEWTFQNFDVVRFNGDPAWWQEEMARWAAEYGSPPITEFWTGGRSEAKMATATGATKTALGHGMKINPVPLRTPQFAIAEDGVPREGGGGTPIVQWYLENARTRKIRIKRDDERTEDAQLLRKERAGSPLKIDGATGIVLARRARDDGVKLGLFEKKRRPRRAAWQ